MRRPLRSLLWTLAAVIAAPVLLLVVLAIDANWLKSPLERWVGDKTGRELAIDGDLDVHLAWPPRISVEGLRFSNPAWAGTSDMVRLQRGEVSIALPPLLRGRVTLPLLVLTAPEVDLERTADGTANWTLAGPAAPQSRGPVLPEIGRLRVDRGTVRFRDPVLDADLSVELATGDAARPLRFKAAGRFQGQEVTGDGGGGPILSLADTTRPYPLEAKLKVGPTEGTVSGTITGLTALVAADLQLDLRGESMSQLFPLLHITLPPTPPYRVKGNLLREGAWWRFHGFEGHVGDSDLSGDVDVHYGEGRSKLLGKLQSQVLDLDDLGGFIGAAPAAGPGETASPRQKQAAAAKAASPKLLPDVPLDFARLRAMDADVRLEGRSIRGKTAIEDLKTRLVLQDGRLVLDPLDFGVAGGSIVGTLVLDGRNDVAGVGANIEARRLDMRKMFPGNATVARSTGIVGGRAKLEGQGRSLAEVLGQADGTLGLALSGGRVSNMLLELAGLDAAETLKYLFKGDRQVAVRCGVIDASVKHGVVTARSAVLDTTDTNVKLEGSVDLGNEQLDLTLHPLPKDYSLLALRSPLHLKGTFKALQVRPDRELAERAGIAGILAALAGPLALVALIETGPGDDVNCEKLVAAVQRHVSETPAPAPPPPSGAQ